MLFQRQPLQVDTTLFSDECSFVVVEKTPKSELRNPGYTSPPKKLTNGPFFVINYIINRRRWIFSRPAKKVRFAWVSWPQRSPSRVSPGFRGHKGRRRAFRLGFVAAKVAVARFAWVSWPQRSPSRVSLGFRGHQGPCRRGREGSRQLRRSPSRRRARQLDGSGVELDSSTVPSRCRCVFPPCAPENE